MLRAMLGRILTYPMGIVRFRIVATHNRLPALAVADNALTGKSEPQVNMYPFVRCPRWSLIGPSLGETHLFVGPFLSTCSGVRFRFVLSVFLCTCVPLVEVVPRPTEPYDAAKEVCW